MRDRAAGDGPTMDPLVTGVVPAYNCAQFIEEALA